LEEKSINLGENYNKFNFWFNPIPGLIIVGIIGLLIRLYFIDTEVPLVEDSYQYFSFAIDKSLLQESSSVIIQLEKFWPTLLSIFFSITNFENFLGYMALQKFITVGLSVITIIPVYYLCKQFFNRQYAVIGTALFVLEPHIIQNSLTGLSEPLFIFVGTIAFAIFFNKNSKISTISFGVFAVFAMIRSQGIIIFPIIATVFLIRFRNEPNLIRNFLIGIAIFLVIIGLFMIIRGNESSDDVLFLQINQASENILDSSNQNEGIFSDRPITGTSVLLKKIAQSMIPIFGIFVPFGIFEIIKNKSRDGRLIFVILIISLASSIYIFSRINDIRYILWLYPILVVISIFTIKRIVNNLENKNAFVFLFFIGILLFVGYFLVSEDISQRNNESYKFAGYVYSNTEVINWYVQVGYIESIRLTELDSFPISSSDLPPPKINIIELNPYKYFSIEEFVRDGKDLGLTHLVVDDTSKKYSILDDVFYNESRFPYLEKIYDTKENGYTSYHGKIFEINYVLFKN